MAKGTEKNTQAIESQQVLTYTKSGKSLIGTFSRAGNFVICSLRSTGALTWSTTGWSVLFSGLRTEFQPKDTVITAVGQPASSVQGIAVRGINEESTSYGNAGNVSINIATSTALWVEGYFIYYVG